VESGHPSTGASVTSTGRLMLAVLGGLADVERDPIPTRTAEGRSRAKAQGKQMGRPPALTPPQQKEATRRRGGRYARRTRPQLQRWHIHHSSRDCAAL
jgi:DNA invertase Pin-like site-specific DNA recombinase